MIYHSNLSRSKALEELKRSTFDPQLVEEIVGFWEKSKEELPGGQKEGKIAMKRILLLAGEGNIPLLVYKKAQEEGEVLVLSSLSLSPPEGLEPDLWIDGLSLAQVLEIVQQEKITHICLAGKVPKNLVFEENVLHEELERLFFLFLNTMAGSGSFTSCAYKISRKS